MVQVHSCSFGFHWKSDKLVVAIWKDRYLWHGISMISKVQILTHEFNPLLACVFEQKISGFWIVTRLIACDERKMWVRLPSIQCGLGRS